MKTLRQGLDLPPTWLTKERFRRADFFKFGAGPVKLMHPETGAHVISLFELRLRYHGLWNSR